MNQMIVMRIKSILVKKKNIWKNARKVSLQELNIVFILRKFTIL